MENDNQVPYGPDPPSSSPPRKARKQIPQKTVDDFWDAFTTKFPGKVHTILPKNAYARSKAAHEPKGVVHSEAALKSYKATNAECVAAVEKIARECRRVNMRYRDPHFDIEFDLKLRINDCLEGLTDSQSEPFVPKSVKRVPEIFDNPQFYVDDATASDVRQGNDGDCWFLSALCALGNKKGLIERVCVARDEAVGVYGFVFHRDGEWIYTIIDDKLYLNSTDYDESKYEKFSWDQVFHRQDAEEEYRKAYQTGSRALYFAQCSHENETWLPLLEKAFAKAHGDYRAIDGGFTGEAIEDLTGGVTTELFTTDILDKDKFWSEEIMKVNKEFLFGCATGCFDDWQGGGRYTDRKGVVSMHAYSILEAVEIKGERLLRVRNPWGKTEWQGAWSDGSEQWTLEWMKLLNHEFGNDGIFWISYKDLLRKYQSFDRTRLFGPEWTVTQQWTTLDVPWTADYNDTKFNITLSKKTNIVIVLSQLDDRYYQGLQGQYEFSLHFRLDKEGENGYIVRSHGNYLMNRSVSTDLELDAGTYSVLMKITAKRYPFTPTPEDTLRKYCAGKQEKLLQIGLAYDLAHAKGQIVETEEAKKHEAEREEKLKAIAKAKERKEISERKKEEWTLRRRRQEREERQKLRFEEHKRKKADQRKAANLPEKSTGGNVAADNTKTPMVNGDAKNVDSKERVIEPTADKKADEPENAPKDASPVVANGDSTEPSAKANALESSKAQPNPPTEINGKDLTTQAKIDQFNKDLQAIPPITVNGQPLHEGSTTTAAYNDNDKDTDAESVLSFVDSVDSILDEHLLEPRDGLSLIGPELDMPALGAKLEDDENVEFANDPWNAVCVVGLRVFSKGEAVSVTVVRPKGGEEEEESPLDLDDPSKGMSEEAPVVENGEVKGKEQVNGVASGDGEGK